MYKKILSVFLTIAIVLAPTPAWIFAAEPDPGTPEGQYEILTGRLEAAKLAVEAAAEENGVIDFGNGYILDLRQEMLDFAANIDVDLGVAAALAAGIRNAPAYQSLGSRQGRGGTDNDANFNAFLGRFGGPLGAALAYLRQGGIAERQRGLTLTWFYWFGSALNTDYSASESVLGLTQNNRLPNSAYPYAGDVADIAESYAINLIVAASRLSDATDMIRNYVAQADPENLKAYLLEQECNDKDCNFDPCDNDYCEDMDCPDGNCPDWRNRLMVDEEEWLEAISEFQSNIARDIDIIGQLATGEISGFWSENRNGYNYYNNTFAPNAFAKITAALDYIQDGGFTCGIPGGGFFADTNTWLWYKSDFTGYLASHSSGIAGGSFSVEGEDEIIPLIEIHLDILKMGATPSGLETVYNFKRDAIYGYFDQAYSLIGSTVPAGGAYGQTEYDAAIEAFIAGAERDLAIADALYTGFFTDEVIDYASTWVGLGSSPDSFYLNGFNYIFGNASGPGDTQDKRLFNAISFFNNGGYGSGFSLDLSFIGLGRIGIEIEFKSSFHHDYSSGLFGIAANKVNAINVLRDTLADLSAGNPYLSPLDMAKLRYAEAKAQLLTVKEDPSAIVAALLENDEELGRLLDDLNMLIGSLDDIVNIIDLIGSLGIDSGIINTILQPLGLNYDMLQQLAGLRETLNNIGIDTSGNQPIEEALTPYLAPILGIAIDGAVLIADGTALLGTVDAYNNAAGIVEGAYVLLYENALDAINGMLGPVMDLIAPIRPYLDMLSSGISLVNNVLKLVDQVGTLTSDFNLGNLSETTYTLAYTLDDLADLMVAFEASNIGSLLGGVLGGLDLGGAVSGGLAGLLNNIVNGAIGSDVLDLSGDNLGFLGDLANNLLVNGLNNPTALVPLLRASATILRNAAAVENGLNDLFSGNYQTILSALVGMFTGEDNIITGVVGLWNAISDLFLGASGSVPEEIQAMTELMPAAFQTALFAEAGETSAVLSNPAVGENVKRAKLNEFISYMFDVREYIKEMREMIYRMEDACDWAKANFTEENAKQFIEAFARYYANELLTCVKDGVRASNLPNVIAGIKAISCEAADILRYIKGEGALTIIAAPIIGEDNAHYTFSTNYDALKAKLDQFFSCLLITDGFEILSDSSGGGFYLDGNILRSVPGFFTGFEPGSASFNVKVAYVLNFGCLSHDRPSILATKLVNVSLDIEPDVTLVGATPAAYVDRINGNQNRLYITVIEEYSDGTTKAVEWNGLINNNAAGIYQVGGYRVYVDTKGNTQIRECYIVE